MNKKETGKGVWGLATKNVGYCCMDWYELMHQPTDTYSQLSFEERVIFKNMTLTSRPETLNHASPQGQEEGPLGKWSRVTILEDSMGLPAQLR